MGVNAEHILAVSGLSTAIVGLASRDLFINLIGRLVINIDKNYSILKPCF